jgi:hypothetical protein
MDDVTTTTDGSPLPTKPTTANVVVKVNSNNDTKIENMSQTRKKIFELHRGRPELTQVGNSGPMTYWTLIQVVQ